MKARVAWYLLSATFFVCFGLSVVAQSTTYKELPNFHEVNSRLYRGAQPRWGGINRLVQLGIKTVVNLREGDDQARAEEAEARAAGLRYFNVPFKRTGRPTDQQVSSVLSIINDTENQPVFVHCKLGKDRTGTVIAVYRIAHDGWTSERAKAEANRYGMHPWELGMKDYIHDFYQGRGRASEVPPPAKPKDAQKMP
jgi:tyrosine-protein phosphatase SIW14